MLNGNDNVETYIFDLKSDIVEIPFCFEVKVTTIILSLGQCLIVNKLYREVYGSIVE